MVDTTIVLSDTEFIHKPSWHVDAEGMALRLPGLINLQGIARVNGVEIYPGVHEYRLPEPAHAIGGHAYIPKVTAPMMVCLAMAYANRDFEIREANMSHAVYEVFPNEYDLEGRTEQPLTTHCTVRSRCPLYGNPQWSRYESLPYPDTTMDGLRDLGLMPWACKQWNRMLFLASGEGDWRDWLPEEAGKPHGPGEQQALAARAHARLAEEDARRRERAARDAAWRRQWRSRFTAWFDGLPDRTADIQ